MKNESKHLFLKTWEYLQKRLRKIPFRVSLLLISVFSIFIIYYFFMSYKNAKEPVKIGILHSLTGTMAMSESPLVDAVNLAVDEANQSGGINGRKIIPIFTDCRSDPYYCAKEAERLISSEKVSALFGCWTSACRKAVKVVVENHHHLLFYPVQYEGLESSPDIIYTGAAPNQQTIPMSIWALHNKGRRFYLIGSDYIFPRSANHMIKEVLSAQGGTLLAERYVPLAETQMDAFVKEINYLHPDFVINTLNGDSNRYFFSELRKAGVTPDKIPVFSTSIAEVEAIAMGPELLEGHYTAWNYFQSLDNSENIDFVKRFKKKYGQNRVIDDPMASSYISVKLWVAAAREQDSVDPTLLKTALAQETMPAPEGIVAVDYDTRHLWKKVYIGKARSDGQFDIVWQSNELIHPSPFPSYHSHYEWIEKQKNLMGESP